MKVMDLSVCRGLVRLHLSYAALLVGLPRGRSYLHQTALQKTKHVDDLTCQPHLIMELEARRDFVRRKHVKDGDGRPTRLETHFLNSR